MISTGDIERENRSDRKFLTKSLNIVVECSNDSIPSSLASWESDSLGCTCCNVEHLLERFMLEGLNWLSFPYVITCRKTALKGTYLIRCNQPFNGYFLHETIGVRWDVLVLCTFNKVWIQRLLFCAIFRLISVFSCTDCLGELGFKPLLLAPRIIH